VLALLPISQVHAQSTMRIADSSDASDLYLQAESFLASGYTRNAYELLRAYESALSGNPYFDYLLGVASLDSGYVNEAILSLQRAATAAPDFSGARMELARAHYEAAEYGTAQAMFAALLDEDPPPAVREVITGYINAIDARPSSPPSRFSPYGELFTGHDSNANGSTESEQFLGFTLSPENQAIDSMFFEAAAGFDWSLPRSTNFGWFIGARASYRDNPDAPFVDAGIVNGLASMNWRSGAFFGRVGVDAYTASRDGESNETYGGANLLLGSSFGDRWDLSLAIRSGALNYDESIEVLDVTRTLYTLATSYRFTAQGKLSVEVIGGNDDARENGSPYGNSKTGGRIALMTGVGERSYLTASIGSLSSDYDGLFFGAPREDQQLTSFLQIEFHDVWTNGLTLAPRLRYIDNESDVDLYTYDRTEFGLMIRWAPQ
jgi:tetratricopeptide (TPR) repeat protein